MDDGCIGPQGNPDSPLFIMDARPRRNARANQAKGLGFESTTNYPNCVMTFLNIHNIHVMRDSFKKMKCVFFVML
jgi:myotubularin-related protein 1/2